MCQEPAREKRIRVLKRMANRLLPEGWYLSGITISKGGTDITTKHGDDFIQRAISIAEEKDRK